MMMMIMSQRKKSVKIPDDEPRVRRLGEDREDVAIICDRGADVALLPLSMADQWEGELEYNAKTKLQDAQGNRIPTEVRKVLKSCCVTLMDAKYFSKHLLCYGRLMEHGWGINGREKTIRNEDESCLEVQVPEALEKAVGWKFNERGRLAASWKLMDRFVDPTGIPEVEDSPELMRTTLVKRGSGWLAPEYCENMMKKEESLFRSIVG